MHNHSTQNDKNRGKIVLAIIITLAFVLTMIYWGMIRLFQLQGLPRYFTQLGLYLVLILLAWWGNRQEHISLPVTKRFIVETLAVSLVGWLFFVLLIHLLGLAQLSNEILALQETPAWKIGLQILSTWLFVGIGEEVLFRGYFLKAFWQHFTIEPSQKRMVRAILLSSVIFSLWHLPIRIAWILSGEMDWITLPVSLLVLFLLGLGFAYLYVRSDNLLLVGLVHGLMDYPLVGKSSQMAPVILVVAIICVEIIRLIRKKKAQGMQQ
ncbi:MAG: CPBP family intramembrane metalloprotease [Anaerolineales bacterium]|nr:CPBP family intramembrane metalloprotease [Anaerolineales bacterium]